MTLPDDPAGLDAGEDARLVARCRSDPAQFSLLYRKYLAPVYRYHLARSGSHPEAEDLTSQTFLAALERLPRYREQGCFAAWLFSIARRKSADHHRRPPAASLDSSLFDEQPRLDLAAARELCGDPFDALVAGEERRLLQTALDELDPTTRELLELRFAARLPFDQIAALLDRKPSAVKMAVYRALQRLARQLEADHAR
ncbi:MAG: RNA polymerase sigma factor [Chloroflexota bacterium]